MSEIKPALTADWWEHVMRQIWQENEYQAREAVEDARDGIVGVPVMKPSRAEQIAVYWLEGGSKYEKGAGGAAHGAAAICLHGQPFGFTWADVDELRGVAEDYEYRGLTPCPFDTLNELADRIAALLPPREAKP